MRNLSFIRRPVLLVAAALLGGCASAREPLHPPEPSGRMAGSSTGLPRAGRVPVPSTREVAREYARMFGASVREEDLPLSLDSAVNAFVAYYSSSGPRRVVTGWFEREGAYGPMISAALEKASLPQGLLFLAMTESGLIPTATSRAGAVGMWQFMRGTAADVGLRVDEWVDERRDPEKSTTAAVTYLRDLYRATNDWALTAASYNAGLGRVQNAQKRTAQSSYFDLLAAGALPKETSEYVPRIVALAVIARDPARYGFDLSRKRAPADVTSITVEPRTRLAAIAKVLGTETETLAQMNPALLRLAAPPDRTYPVRIPSAVATTPEQIAAALGSLPDEERFFSEWKTLVHVVRSGESWWRIARRYDQPVVRLREENSRLPTVLSPGMKISVRLRSDDAARFARLTRGKSAEAERPLRLAAEKLPAEKASAAPKTSGKPKRLPAGSLAARTSDASSGSVANAGNAIVRAPIRERLAAAIENDSTPPAATGGPPARDRSGKPRRVAASSARVHVVMHGETLSGIAARYGVRVHDLVAWNRMKNARPLRTGEKLRVVRLADAS